MRERRGACLATVLAGLWLASPVVSAWAADCTQWFSVGAAVGCVGPGQSVALGDADRDGRPDAVVALGTSNAFAVHRSLAGGALGAAVTFPTGLTTRAVALADLDEDGALDALVAAGGEVQVWRGDGAGGFTRGTTLTLSGTPRALLAHDFNGDGILDLAVANGSANAIMVVRQHGTDGSPSGTFATAVTYMVGTNPVALVHADVTGDGVADLVSADNSGAGITVLPALASNGAATGGFGPMVRTGTAANPFGIAAGDLDRDGRMDLVVSHGGGSSVTILRGLGAAAFSARSVTTPSLPREMALADIDGDGTADLIVACTGTNQVAVLPGTQTGGAPDGGFGAARLFAVGSSPGPLACADTDGDGRADVVVANTGHRTLSRLAGSCMATAPATVALTSPASGAGWWPGQAARVQWSKGPGVQAVDIELSQDGGVKWEPLASNLWGTSATVHVPLPVTPTARLRVRDRVVHSRTAVSAANFDICGLFAGPIDSPTGLAGVIRSALADADGDGVPDLVLLSPTSLRVLQGVGDGTFLSRHTLAVDSARALLLLDTDDDGALDVLTLGAGALTVHAWQDHALTPRASIPLAFDAAAMTAAPLGDDAVPAVVIVGRDNSLGRVQVVRFDGATTTAGGPVQTLAAPGRRVVATDLDGDGRSDIVVATERGIESWRAGADGSFSRASMRDLPAAPGDLALGDLDGDGVLDLTAALTATGDVWRLQGLAGLAFAAPSTHAAGPSPSHLTVTDWEGDGRPDLVLTRSQPEALAVLLGASSPGAGTFFAAPEGFTTPAGTATLVVGDVDGDGAPDAVIASSTGALSVRPAQCRAQRSDTLRWTVVPAAGAEVAPGDTVTLAWSRGPAVASVHIELSRDDGASWQIVQPVAAGGGWTWRVSGPSASAARLRVRDPQVPSRQATSARFTIAGGALEVAATSAPGLMLSAPWPSPTRGSIHCALTVHAAGEGTVEVLDLQGRSVRVLHRGPLAAGRHAFTWDGLDARGGSVEAGVWFVSARVGSASRVQRLVRLR